jgi:hypothetical protein
MGQALFFFVFVNRLDIFYFSFINNVFLTSAKPILAIN